MVRATLLIAVLGGLLPAQTVTLQGPIPAKPEETCSVCNTPVGPGGEAYLADGQRLVVMAAMRDELLANPLQYAKKYRPEGMMFTVRRAGPLHSAYLWIGIYILAGLLFGGLSAHSAMSKGLPALEWFLLGFFFSVPAYLAVAAKRTTVEVPAGLAKIPLTRTPGLCSHCRAGNHPSAESCIVCGAPLTPTAPSEVRSLS